MNALSERQVTRMSNHNRRFSPQRQLGGPLPEMPLKNTSISILTSHYMSQAQAAMASGEEGKAVVWYALALGAVGVVGVAATAAAVGYYIGTHNAHGGASSVGATPSATMPSHDTVITPTIVEPPASATPTIVSSPAPSASPTITATRTHTETAIRPTDASKLPLPTAAAPVEQNLSPGLPKGVSFDRPYLDDGIMQVGFHFTLTELRDVANPKAGTITRTSDDYCVYPAVVAFNLPNNYSLKEYVEKVGPVSFYISPDSKSSVIQKVTISSKGVTVADVKMYSDPKFVKTEQGPELKGIGPSENPEPRIKGIIHGGRRYLGDILINFGQIAINGNVVNFNTLNAGPAALYVSDRLEQKPDGTWGLKGGSSQVITNTPQCPQPSKTK
ncbi:MAG: hypothetical protein V1922_05150 [bacterium]